MQDNAPIHLAHKTTATVKLLWILEDELAGQFFRLKTNQNLWGILKQ